MVNDIINKPKHYTQGSVECIDSMLDTQGTVAVEGFCICNAYKYLYRHNAKNGDEDIKKAIWYLNKYVELKEENKNASGKEAIRAIAENSGITYEYKGEGFGRYTDLCTVLLGFTLFVFVLWRIVMFFK